MAINFEIGSNSEGLKLGLQLYDGLNGDLNKLQNGTATGRAVSSILNGSSTEEKIIGGVSAVLQGMSLNSIGNTLSTLQLIAHDYTDVDSITNAAMDIVQGLIDTLLSDSGTLDAIQKGMDATNDFINMLKKAVMVALEAGQILNVASLLGVLTDQTCIPSVKDCTMMASAGIKPKLTELYKDFRLQLVDMYNQLICTNCDATIDNVMTSVNQILDYLSTYVDPVMNDYTGHTLTETRYYTAQAFQMIKMFLRISLNAKKMKAEAKEKVNDAADQAKDAANGIKNSATDTADSIKNSGIDMSNQMVNLAKQTGDSIKDNFKNLQEDWSDEKIKNGLIEWAQGQSIMLVNAFHLMMIKDLVKQILEKCENIGNMSIENFADFVNSILEIFDLLELFGFYPGAKGITFEDIQNIALALARSPKGIMTNVNAMTDSIANQAIDSAKGLSASAIGDATQLGQSTLQLGLNAGDSLVTSVSSTASGTMNMVSSESLTPGINTSLFLNQANGISGVTDTLGNSVSSLTNSASDVANSGMNAASGAVNSLTGSTINISSDIMNGGTVIFNNTINNGIESATSLLDGISIAALLDMSEVESIIGGKVMMLDVVIQLYNMLQPIIEILTFLCHLMENYLINKETVKNQSFMNINSAIKKIADIAMGLKGRLDGSDCNFYPVRTDELKTWCLSTFKCTIGEGGMSKIGIPETNKLIWYLTYTNRSWGAGKTLDPLKCTILHFADYKPGVDAKDGTLDGIDNIMVDEAGIIYYDPYNRSTISSLILRAQKRDEAPLYGNVEEEEKDFLDDITVYTDEVEGQLTISIPDMNLCQPGEYSNPVVESEIANSDKPYAIIEFGDEYTLGDAVEYKLLVKPGDTLSIDMPIATVSKNGKQSTIYSKFTKGTVLGTSDNSDYYHVYPLSCNRHIIIADYEEGTSFDQNDVSILSNEFDDATVAAANIISYLPYAGLPILLDNCTRNSIESNIIGDYSSKVKEYEEYIEEKAKEFSEAGDCSPDAIKETKGDPDKMQAIMDKMMAKREDIINKAIEVYDWMKEQNLKGSEEYDDCTYLAYGDSKMHEFKMDGDNTVYLNYYMSLYSMTDSESDKPDVIEYRQILLNIIERRKTLERYDLYTLVEEFNTLFISSILNGKKPSVPPFVTIFNINNNVKLDTAGFKYYVKKKYVESRVSPIESINLSKMSESEIDEWFENKILDYSSSTSLVHTSSRLTNIFFYLLEQCDGKIPLKVEQPEKSQDLVIQETIEVCGSVFDEYILSTTEDMVVSVTSEAYKKAKDKKSSDPKKPITEQDRINYFFEYLNDKVKEISNHPISDENMNHLKKFGDRIYDMAGLIYSRHSGLSYSVEKKTSDFVEKRLTFTLIKQESKEISEFWDKTIAKYKKDYQIKNVIEKLKNYADNLVALGEWPLEQDIDIAGKTYQLYLFLNGVELEEKMPSFELDLPPEKPAPWDQELDYTSNADIKEPDKNTIRTNSYTYWLVYMLNATLLTLIPIYWADGFDIPPFMTPLLLPAIYLPIAPPIYIPLVNITMVIGIALRGIWPMPIILIVNNNTLDINAMFPVMIALEISRKLFKAGQELVEKGVKTAIDAASDTIVGSGDEAKKIYDKFMTYASLIKSIPVEDKELIEKEFYAALYDDDAKTAHDKGIKAVSDKMQLSLDDTEKKINAGNDKLNKKIEKSKEDAINKYDKRLVITRLDKLGQGPQPF